MASDVKYLVKNSELYELAEKGRASEFSDDFNRRLTHAMNGKHPRIIEFLQEVLNDGIVLNVWPNEVRSVYRNLLSHAEAHLLFVK